MGGYNTYRNRCSVAGIQHPLLGVNDDVKIQPNRLEWSEYIE